MRFNGHFLLRTAVVLLLLILGSEADGAEGVVLLHGLCRSSASMKEMERALAKEGYVVLNVDYPSRTATVEALSESIIGAALRSPRLAETNKIHFVAHSLGGILVRYYFARHHEPRLGRVVMLGPPNKGSEVVDALKDWLPFRKINGPAGSELGTHSHSLPRRLGPVGFELGIIAGDRSINWINSMMIPGPDDGKVSLESTKVEGMKEHVVIHRTHPFIMKARESIELTIRFLKSGSFRAPHVMSDTKGRRDYD
ncbi:MAG TPA: alpha/beta hydrolase [Deltaproteobacteria bacterium]|nr:alpha/beta hydrolase [Deltaproteobacteria bacterium]